MTDKLVLGINSIINRLVWGPGMILFMIITGILLTFMTDFVQIRHFVYMLRTTVFTLFRKRKKASKKGVTPFQAVATAMAATIGTGSIAGLSTAIACGGPGAVFWMWVSAFLGMAVKYSEIVLSVRYRIRSKSGEYVGGPMYYIKNGLGFRGLSVMFAIMTALSCFGIGNAVQSNSIAVSLNAVTGLNPCITGIVLTVICGAVILGGIKRIARVNEKLVPFMALLYVICSVTVLVLRYDRIPSAFASIFEEALNVKSVAGGALGYGMSHALRYGFSGGIFSNEAGLGSAPIAHGASDTEEPVVQGMWGIFEVFFTTVVICTMTALVVLTSNLWQNTAISGAQLSIGAFDSAVKGFGSICVTMCTILFALSSILGWAYYGEVSIDYIFRGSQKCKFLYKSAYVMAVYIGAVGSVQAVWSLAETLNVLMALPNLTALIFLRDKVREETRNFFISKGQKT